MTDVFISYKREEREWARLLAEALSAEGFSVWWDAEILPGEQYRAVTLEILQSCRAALVIWSQKSAASNWVLDEAQRALERGVLIPVMFERLEHYPLGFGQVHALDLVGWQGDAKAAPFQPVLAAVRRLAGPPAAKEAPARASAEVEAEVAFWRGVQDSLDAAFFEAYLARYPDGLFADLARQRIAALSAAPPARGRKRTSVAPRAPSSRKRKAAAAEEVSAAAPASVAAPLGVAAMRPSPQALKPPFDRWELGFIAAVALIAPFPAWPIANRLLGAEKTFYDQDFASLFSFDTLQNIFIMVPLLTGLAWLYDRGVDAWAARGQLPDAPRFAVPALIVIFFLGSLAMRENNGQETHLALWLAATWAAATFARPAAAWFRQRLPQLIRTTNKSS